MKKKIFDGLTIKCPKLSEKDIKDINERISNIKFFYEYHKLKCQKCGKKILVEINQCGISHIVTITATCAECLDFKNEEFKKEHPKAVKNIVKWKNNYEKDSHNNSNSR